MDSFALIIFGITSNLAQKYLLRALYDMAERKLLPENISIIGSARKPMGSEEFQDYLKEVLVSPNKHHAHQIKMDVLKDLSKRIHYVNGNLDDPMFYKRLKEYLEDLDKKGKPSNNKIFYLATYPELYETIFENLKKSSLSSQDKGWARLMVEKPIGHDLDSAKRINQLLLKYFSEDQIFRLDHYLGKETLRNILTFRFGNGVFEPLINNQFIDHIQITASEDFGIGKRGGYYDTIGALRDVGQNHQLQMLAFATMDTPSEFTNKEITKERIKIFKDLVTHPKKIVFGQYEGYTKEENVAEDSQTETFYALKTEIKSARFKGVPIYIRAGKMLSQTVTEISIVFKNPEIRVFKNSKKGVEPNVLIYRIQPNEGIVLRILTNKPGSAEELESSYMQYCYPQDSDFHALKDPYEQIISDAIRGNQTFFNDAEEVETQWEFIDPLMTGRKKLLIYKPGTWGPKEATELIETDGREWLEPSMMFCSIPKYS